MIESRANQLLATLDSSTSGNPLVKRVDLQAGDTLHEVGQPINDVFFPVSGIVCLATVLQTGEVVANALIGLEGVVGYGRTLSIARSVVQVPGRAMRMSVADLRNTAASVPAFREAISRFNDVLVAQIQQTVACYAAHSLEARLCRWLLCAADRIRSDELQLTQQSLANMLGVHRGSVNAAMATLQANGAVACERRGHVRVDRERAAGMSCECYGRLKRFECERIGFLAPTITGTAPVTAQEESAS